jgi:hypothetical protein
MKASLILLLLLSIEQVLLLNQITLKMEASKSIKNLFGITYSFSTNLMDREYVIHYGNPKITAKLSSSCSTSFSFGSKSGSYTIKRGAVVSERGTKVNLSQNSILFVGKNLNVNFSTMTATLTKKLKGSVYDGTVNFIFSATEAKIEIIYNSKGTTQCDGKLTITIKPGVNPKPSLQPAFNQQAIQNATNAVLTGGAIAIGAVLIFKLAKGVAGFMVGGPVLGLVGVMS